MIKLGQKVRFDPLEGMLFYGADSFRTTVTGVITAIYKAHRWFLVEYGEKKIRMAFKFDDVGETVNFV